MPLKNPLNINKPDWTLILIALLVKIIIITNQVFFENCLRTKVSYFLLHWNSPLADREPKLSLISVITVILQTSTQ